MIDTIKISKKTIVAKAAGAVAHKLRAGEEVKVSGVGKFGTLKAAQTVTLARRYVKEDGGFDINVKPDFVWVEYEDETVKGIEFHVTKCE